MQHLSLALRGQPLQFVEFHIMTWLALDGPSNVDPSLIELFPNILHLLKSSVRYFNKQLCKQRYAWKAALWGLFSGRAPLMKEELIYKYIFLGALKTSSSYSLVRDLPRCGRGGKYQFEIQRMHEKYGPIVRISPYELHIHDPDYYDTIYAGPVRVRDRYDWFVNVGAPESTLAAAHHDIHRRRRKTFSPYFSKQAVSGIGPLIQERVNRLCVHFSRARETGEALELHACFASLASDIVSEYLFGKAHATRFLDQPTITDEWKRVITGMFELLSTLRHFPWLATVGELFPFLVPYTLPPAVSLPPAKDAHLAVQRVLNADEQECDSTAVIPRILGSDKVPPEEKQLARLADEVAFLQTAGTDAPSQALAISMYHILNNPNVLARLKAELTTAFPTDRPDPTWSQLEKLPYFGAVIKECLRISALVLVRLPRIAPYEILQYGEWQIPAGTPVGMSIHYILRDPTIFPEPLAFRPERWLQEGHTLDR
ncbi:hypothetical protein FE257_004410 [Aspergillus nanangensis]|uniref:Cytochrome P450 n=1 Tax=Aspergillus nanangensis TaxID=2582783 RepID=A0AAD4CY14_ASPNN|nr:hypothetical protein FE257_004410 [Aspergillus nanangensis]